MTADSSRQPLDTKAADGHFSLIDLLAIRMTYEHATMDMHDCLLRKCRLSEDPVICALDLSQLRSLTAELTGHLQLLAQALDVLGEKPEQEHQTHMHEPFLTLIHAAHTQACEPATPVLAAMQALMAVVQYNEVAWGLLLALIKDAELQRFVHPFERACTQHRTYRMCVQQTYENVVLGLMQGERIVMRSGRPLKSSIVGRSGPLFDASRHV